MLAQAWEFVQLLLVLGSVAALVVVPCSIITRYRAYGLRMRSAKPAITLPHGITENQEA